LNLIIDSGATKSDWLFFDKEIQHHFISEGINPMSNQNTDDISNPASKFLNARLTHIFYYGAGVVGEDKVQLVKDQLKKLFPETEQIVIYSDLLGACRACSNKEISLVSILGTGSNSCIFDGSEIKSHIPSLGYLLGDEGSGFRIGKEVIKSYFYGYMPENDRDRFADLYSNKTSSILDVIYSSKKPNYTIASYAIFLKDSEAAYKHYILERIFQEFIDQRIKQLQSGMNMPMNFVGSIAYNYRDILKKICERNGFQINKFVEKPIQELYKYHYNNEYK
jgi:N-acetylglucosamine kinase-like BadF-type ATPase